MKYKMKKIFSIATVTIIMFMTIIPYAVGASTDMPSVWKAEVTDVLKEENTIVPGTNTEAKVQTLRIKLLEGEKAGQTVTIENDYIDLQKGDKFFVSYIKNQETGNETYTVKDRDRIRCLLFFPLSL